MMNHMYAHLKNRGIDVSRQIPHIKDMAHQYSGREELLFSRLQKKYGEVISQTQLHDWIHADADAPQANLSSETSLEANNSDMETVPFRQQVANLWRLLAPEKLIHLDTTMRVFR